MKYKIYIFYKNKLKYKTIKTDITNLLSKTKNAHEEFNECKSTILTFCCHFLSPFLMT